MKARRERKAILKSSGVNTFIKTTQKITLTGWWEGDRFQQGQSNQCKATHPFPPNQGGYHSPAEKQIIHKPMANNFNLELFYKHLSDHVLRNLPWFYVPWIPKWCMIFPLLAQLPYDQQDLVEIIMFSIITNTSSFTAYKLSRKAMSHLRPSCW